MIASQRFIFGLISLHLIMGCTGGNGVCKASIGHGWACPPSWYQWGRNCYKASTERLTWFEARDDCLKIGGALVVPQSQEEVDFLRNLIPESTLFWVNCNDLENEGTWKCRVGSAEVELETWPVGGGRPHTTEEEDCAEIRPNGVWNDNICGKPHRVICVQPAPQLRN